MRPKSLILLVLALGCGLVASIGINRVMANRPAAQVVEGDTVSIFVAALDVNQNDLVPKEAIKEEQWPAAKVPPGAIMVLEDVEGRRCRSKLYAGEPFLEAKLLAKGAAAQSYAIPAGLRAVAVRVDDVTSLGSLLLPGDRVDIMVHLPPMPERGIREAMTKTFLQDIKVFAVNDVTERAPGGGEAKITARTVSFLVDPNQAELITQASELGRVRLVLRSSSDSEIVMTQGADFTGLLGAGGGNGNRAAEAFAAEQPKAPVIDQILAPPAAIAALDMPAHNEFKMTIMRGSDVQEYVLDSGSSIARPAASDSEESAPPAEPESDEPEQPDNELEGQDESTQAASNA
ncbi:MAG: Flp pilus assembly protein CpaB [Pirellulales bacterium]